MTKVISSSLSEKEDLADAVLSPDNVEEHVAQGVSGVASLAGPSPLELDDTDTDGASCKRLDKTRNEQQHFTQPEKGDLDGPLVMDLPEYQTCVIPAKGFQRRGAAVQARITARADLMYSAQVLVMPKRAQDGSAQAHPVGTSCPSSAASIDNCTTPRMCLEAADGPAEFDVDISAWISEWNDRATWIQHLGDRARKKDISTPVSQALHQASLDQKTGHQSVMWKLAESEHADDAGSSSGLLGGIASIFVLHNDPLGYVQHFNEGQTRHLENECSFIEVFLIQSFLFLIVMQGRKCQ